MKKQLIDQILNEWNSDEENILNKNVSNIVNGYSELENLKNSLIAVASDSLLSIKSKSIDSESKELKIDNIITVLDFAVKLNLENEMNYLDILHKNNKKKTIKNNPFLKSKNPIEVWFKNGVDPSANKTPLTIDDYMRLNEVK